MVVRPEIFFFHNFFLDYCIANSASLKKRKKNEGEQGLSFHVDKAMLSVGCKLTCGHCLYQSDSSRTCIFIALQYFLLLSENSTLALFQPGQGAPKPRLSLDTWLLKKWIMSRFRKGVMWLKSRSAARTNLPTETGGLTSDVKYKRGARSVWKQMLPLHLNVTGTLLSTKKNEKTMREAHNEVYGTSVRKQSSSANTADEDASGQMQFHYRKIAFVETGYLLIWKDGLHEGRETTW